jgi:PAS domain S-box-containing protein
MIGSGNLDFEIQEKRNDEIGDLARAFNRMTSNLKTVTASKTDLEKEIAERKQTELALKESEARATALIKYAPTGIYEIDMSGPRFLSANDAVSILTGYSREELFAMGPMGLLDGDSRRLFAERIRHQLAGDKIDETVDYKVKKKDGSLIAITLNVSFSKQRPGTAFVIGHDVTERRRAEEAVQKLMIAVQLEKDRLSTLVNSIPDEVWFADTQKNFTLANPAALNEIGYNNVAGIEVESMATNLEVFRPDGTPRPVEEAPPLRALKGETIRNQEEVVRTPARGELRYRQVSAAPVKDTDGTIIGSVSLVRDITDSKKADEALRESEQRYRLLYSSMNDGMALHEIVYDESKKAIDYTILEVNPMYQYITGLTRDQAVGKKATELYGTNEPPYLDVYAAVASYGNSRSFETYFPPMGKYFNISVFSPKPGTFATVFSDITARRKAEQDISNLAVKRQLLHEASLQVVAEKDITGIMTRVSDAARALTGARVSVTGHGYVNGQFTVGGSSHAEGSKACPQGKDFGIERGGIYLDLIKTRRSIRLNNEELQKHLSWWGLPEGHAQLNGLLGTSLFDSSGKPNGMIMVSDKTDGENFTVTDEAFLSQLASIASLAIQQVESRRAAEQKAAELEVSNKELESFSYTVSHDLRAPLRGMDGFSLAVLEDYGDKLDAQGRTYLQNIRNSSQLMARLIDDILSLSRVTRATLNWDEVDLSSLAEDIQIELKKTRPERQVEFIIQPGLVTHGDRNLLKLVLDNLLSNAYKFTGKHEHSRIEFGMKNEAKEGIFFVKDNGAGFDMTYADKLFLPFQRLHKTEDFPGTGIGLASVHRIIARHGGRIWAESEIEKGATFYFTIREER